MTEEKAESVLGLQLVVTPGGAMAPSCRLLVVDQDPYSPAFWFSADTGFVVEITADHDQRQFC